MGTPVASVITLPPLSIKRSLISQLRFFITQESATQCTEPTASMGWDPLMQNTPNGNVCVHAQVDLYIQPKPPDKVDVMTSNNPNRMHILFNSIEILIAYPLDTGNWIHWCWKSRYLHCDMAVDYNSRFLTDTFLQYILHHDGIILKGERRQSVSFSSFK